jgi:hypothetical protein
MVHGGMTPRTKGGIHLLKTLLLYTLYPVSLTPKEAHGLRVFQNRVLRRIFGPKREEVAGGWRRMHNEELHNLYTSSNISVIKST